MTARAADGCAPLVLASGSPRRRELLTRAGVELEVIPAEIPERRGRGEAAEDFARRLAREKALTVARRVGSPPPRWVLAADTVVVVGDAVLGKPDDAEHAVQLLSRLVGRRHRVVTAIALVDSGSLRSWSDTVESVVSMRSAETAELRAYVATGESLDKAGAYGLQGGGRRFVECVDGSETNVIGLPLDETLALLRRVGARTGP